MTLGKSLTLSGPVSTSPYTGVRNFPCLLVCCCEYRWVHRGSAGHTVCVTVVVMTLGGTPSLQLHDLRLHEPRSPHPSRCSLTSSSSSPPSTPVFSAFATHQTRSDLQTFASAVPAACGTSPVSAPREPRSSLRCRLGQTSLGPTPGCWGWETTRGTLCFLVAVAASPDALSLLLRVVGSRAVPALLQMGS